MAGARLRGATFQASGQQDSLQPEKVEKRKHREDLELAAIARVWWFHRSFLAITTIIATLSSVSFLAMQDRQYTAEALVRVTVVPNRRSKGAQQTLVDPRQNAAMATTLVSLSSPLFLRNVAEKAQLFTDPEFVGDQPDASDKGRWPIVSRLLGGGQQSPAEADEKKPTDSQLSLRNAVVDALADRLIITQRGGSNVISLATTIRDPEKASLITNLAARMFLDEERARRKAAEADAMRWLTSRIEKQRGILVGLEGQILEASAKRGLYGIDQEQFIDQTSGHRVVELTTHLASLEAKGTELRSQYQEMAARMEAHDVQASLALAKSPALDDLRSEETHLLLQQSELGRDLGDNHPVMINLRHELDATRQLMVAELHSIKERLQGELVANTAREENIAFQLALLKDEISEQKKATGELIGLREQLSSGKDYLNELLANRQRVEQQQATGKDDAVMLSPATVPAKSSHPTFWPDVLLFSLGGFCLALAMVFFWERWISDFGFKNTVDLRRDDLTPLGFIPELPKRTAAGLAVADYVAAYPHSAQAEAIQRIRSTLCQMRSADGRQGTVTLIASPEPLEGKTTTAAILARQTAMSGARTLLIDADIRNPNVHTILGLERSAGLCELLAGVAPHNLRLSRDRLTSLAVLQAGTFAARSPDQLRSPLMENLLTALRGHYDWIYIDAPCLGAVVDGLILARHADLTLCLVRWLDTTRNAVQATIDQLHDAGANLTGIALSRVDMAAAAKYKHLDEIRYYGYYDQTMSLSA